MKHMASAGISFNGILTSCFYLHRTHKNPVHPPLEKKLLPFHHKLHPAGSISDGASSPTSRYTQGAPTLLLCQKGWVPTILPPPSGLLPMECTVWASVLVDLREVQESVTAQRWKWPMDILTAWDKISLDTMRNSVVQSKRKLNSKFCRLPGISRSDCRGQDLRNKLCLARALASQISPFKRFGLNL